MPVCILNFNRGEDGLSGPGEMGRTGWCGRGRVGWQKERLDGVSGAGPSERG
jgi:hypothetical protein